MVPATAISRGDTYLGPFADRVERTLGRLLATSGDPGGPPRLRAAMAHAVFSGGGRLRPMLCLAVAKACGDPEPEASNAVAGAVELMHCASLVHDDLPCFDDAPLRRGQPTVHAAFGVPLAVLAGDALIVLAFSALARPRGERWVATLAQATGPVRGIVAGQAWESEAACPLDEYHRAKTAALFEAAATLGAQAAGSPGDEWRSFGELVGRAYQAADDVLDAVASPAASGKTGGRDAALSRPSVVRAYGLRGAQRRVTRLLGIAEQAIPRGSDDGALRAWLTTFAARVGSCVAADGAAR
jgi:geranylgeranyl diphosphate synthase type II